MNWQDNKLEISVITATAIGFAAVMMMSQYLHSGKRPTWMNISYEMPRPKSTYTSEFDLANREVVRSYINPNAKQAGAAATTAALKATAKATLLEKSKETAKAQAAAAKTVKKPELKVRVISKDEKPGLAETGAKSDVTYSGPVNQVETNKHPNKGAVKTAKVDEEQKDWKKIFSTTPTQQNMIDFIQAYYAHKVADDQYFEVLKELLTSQNEQNQALGIYGLRSVYTARSFTEAVHYELASEIQKKANLETTIQNYLLGYNQPKHLGLLDSALRASDNDVVLKAAQVIVDGITKIKAGDSVGGDSRDGRNPIASSSLTSYQKFVPTLKILEHSSDQDVVTAATSALTQIQSVTTIAQNP